MLNNINLAIFRKEGKHGIEKHICTYSCNKTSKETYHIYPPMLQIVHKLG